MDVKIDHLFRHPRHLPLVAEWIYREFWADRPGYSPEFFAGLLRDAADPDRIPLSLLALSDGEPAGTINLIDNDDRSRPHLHPWLAALVVVPAFRKRGLGTLLVRSLLREAGRLGFREVFFGSDIPAYYLKLGAEYVEKATESLWIMRFRDFSPLVAPVRQGFRRNPTKT